MDCASCGRVNPTGVLHCLTCGTPLAAVSPGLATISATALTAPPPIAPAASDVSPPLAPPVSSALGGAAPRPYTPTFAPADRESFFDEQRRNRRATWRLSAVCVLAAVVTGIPLSLVLTPLLFAVVLLLTRLVDVVTPVPMTVWNAYESVALVLVRAFQQFDDSSSGATTAAHHVSTGAVVFGAAVWLLPGIVAMLLIWTALRTVFRSGGVDGLLLAMDARPPRPGDLEERQLVNVVEEMALAAGIPTPRVLLLDAAVANAAAVGSSPRDAAIVVARPLLDDLNRDETQGILACVIGSIANGDLGVAMSSVAVFQTFGFAAALVKAPISRESRAVLWRVLRYAFGRNRAGRAADAEAVSELLRDGAFDTDDTDMMKMDADGAVAPRPGVPPQLLWGVVPAAFAWYIFASIKGYPHTTIVWGWTALGVATALAIWYQRRYLAWVARDALLKARAIIILPYYMAAMMPQIMIMMLIPFMLEPLLALTWRTRKYLADATAVQLTRNPDGLADGLLALTRRGALLPGGKLAAPLFVIGGAAAGRQQMQRLHAVMDAGTPAATAPTVAGDDPDIMRTFLSAVMSGTLTPAQRDALVAQVREAVGPAQAQRVQAALDAQAQAAGNGAAVAGAKPSPADMRSFIGAAMSGKLTPEQLATFEALKAAADAGGSQAGGHAGDGFGGQGDSIVNFHPSLKRRLHKLRRMGASVGDDADGAGDAGAIGRRARELAAERNGRPGAPRGKVFGIGLFGLIAVPLLILAGVLMLVALVLMAALALLFTAILMMAVYGLFYLVVPH